MVEFITALQSEPVILDSYWKLETSLFYCSKFVGQAVGNMGRGTRKMPEGGIATAAGRRVLNTAAKVSAVLSRPVLFLR